jgi:hypothetical protein
MASIKRSNSKQTARPEQLSDLSPEERRKAVEGGTKEEFFRRLRQVKEWRKARLAHTGQKLGLNFKLKRQISL